MTKQLIASPRKLNYNSSQRDDFLNQLATDSSKKRVVTVEVPEAVYIDPKHCRMGGKYQLTQVGADQLFGYLAKGLYQTIRSLSAEERADIRHADIPGLAAQIVNRIVKHRFPVIEGMRAVCCDDRVQMDGFVSRSYAMVSNERVFELFNDACQLMQSKMFMYSAELSGRNMTCVYTAKDAVKTSGDKSSGIYAGAICQNGETAGRAIRAAITLRDELTRSWSVAPFDRSLRIPHTKSRKLRDRMMAIGDGLARQQMDAREVSGRLRASVKIPAAKSWSKKSIAALRGKIGGLADKYGANMQAIDRAMELLPEEGAYRPPSIFNLYAALLTEADAQAVGASIPMRQLAYHIVYKT